MNDIEFKTRIDSAAVKHANNMERNKKLYRRMFKSNYITTICNESCGCKTISPETLSIGKVMGFPESASWC